MERPADVVNDPSELTDPSADVEIFPSLGMPNFKVEVVGTKSGGEVLKVKTVTVREAIKTKVTEEES